MAHLHALRVVTLAAVAALALGVFVLGTARLLACAGFRSTDGGGGVHLGSASALAEQAREVAGAASAVLGVVQAVAIAVSAPLASSGGGVPAVPMIGVMIAGVTESLLAALLLARLGPSPSHPTQVERPAEVTTRPQGRQPGTRRRATFRPAVKPESTTTDRKPPRPPKGQRHARTTVEDHDRPGRNPLP